MEFTEDDYGESKNLSLCISKKPSNNFLNIRYFSIFKGFNNK